MNYYGFHPKKFKFETFNLEPLERLAYRELMDEYMTSEKPLTVNFDDLAWRLAYKTEELKQALKLVLDKFFVIKKLKGDNEPCYHHARMDKEIKNYQSKNGKGTNKVQATTNKVQTGTNETTNETTNQSTNKNSTDAKKSFLIESLKNQGIKANTRMKIGELQTLFDTHCKQNANEIQESTNEVQTTTNPVLTVYNQEPVTSNQEPVTSNQVRESVSSPTLGLSDDEILAVAQKHVEKNVPEFDPLTFLVNHGIDSQLATEFVRYKKSKLKKGEKITQQMLVLVKNQAEKTGKISFADALKIMIASGKWQGFNADWNWQPLFEAVLISENRPIPHWLNQNQQQFSSSNDPLAVNQVWEQRQATGRSALDDLRDMGINVQEGVTTW